MMPCYEPGTTLIIDPDYPASNKNKVVFLLKNKEPICKKLIIDGPNSYLQSHIPDYKPIEITEEDKYCGTIRQVLMEV